eukprot:scaffold4079_cov392-Prasinococcus_capsulatus_cf.AAC.4
MQSQSYLVVKRQLGKRSRAETASQRPSSGRKHMASLSKVYIVPSCSLSASTKSSNTWRARAAYFLATGTAIQGSAITRHRSTKAAEDNTSLPSGFPVA